MTGLEVSLDGSVALVTGASRGIGACIAVMLAELGCDVACAARSSTAAPGTARDRRGHR
jgi:NAD(P)-dependent dehydrogenase (short-subunit alcohol dehydrogenase family)